MAAHHLPRVYGVYDAALDSAFPAWALLLVPFKTLSWTFPSLDAEAAKSKLEVRQVDFNSLSAADIKPSDKVDAAFWCMGTTRKDAGSADTFRKVDLEYVIKSAEVSKAADVSYMDLLTSQGANKNSWFVYPQTK
ncbi:NAD(P)-binding domain [Phytophthora cactorum]|nr:NAD(P)-binding domain [Phytophthora cactorum]